MHISIKLNLINNIVKFYLNFAMNNQVIFLNCFMNEVNRKINVFNGFNFDKIAKNLNHQNSESCPICLKESIRPTKINICMHTFCYICIDEWAKIKNVCPLYIIICTNIILNLFIIII